MNKLIDQLKLTGIKVKRVRGIKIKGVHSYDCSACFCQCSFSEQLKPKR